MTFYQYPDYMYHYGVIGMKWGQHRAAKYRSLATGAKDGVQDSTWQSNYYKKQGKTKAANRYAKYAAKDKAKAKKYAAKAKKIESYHKRMAGSKAYEYTKNQGIIKTTIKSNILGGYGAMKYNQVRAKGASRGKAFLNSAPHILADTLTGGMYGIAEPRVNRPKKKK